MKKLFSYILLTAMLAGLLSGCGISENEAAGASDGAQGAEASDVAGSEGSGLSAGEGGILDPFAVQALEGKDNSLDAYSAAARVSMQAEKPENAIEGGGENSFLGVSAAYHLKKHLLENAAESWDELLFVTAEGKADSKSFDLKNQLWDIGPVVGTNHYVTFGFEGQEGEDYRFFLTERDENHEKIREFPLYFLSGNGFEVFTDILDFAVDQDGAVHLVRQTEDGQQYLLVSQEGEILAEDIPGSGSVSGLIPLYDGRIAYGAASEGDGAGMVLQYMDGETGRPLTLAALEKNIYYCTLISEDTLLYADQEGVYRSGLYGEKPELLYRWMNHGIIAHGVSAMQTDGEGQITLIYSDSENDIYLCLKPTVEEVPLCEITMEVSSLDIESYRWVVAEFNRRYPSCHIELVEHDFEDDAALLTQLTVGKGPVLVDPSLLGFEELEEMWEPLDTVMEQMGIRDELYSGAMEMGKIHGTLYGMVRDFGLRTVVAGDQDIQEWDYDAFLQCVQDRPKMEAICNYYSGAGPYHLISLLNHGLDDNYFFVTDEETGLINFDGGRFRQVLELAEKYCVSEEGVLPGNSLLEGNVLCNLLSISEPEEVAAYRTIYGEDINYVGYPTKDGGAHYMVPSGMLSIRRSAAKEEKEAAAAFMALYLSYEGQLRMEKEVNFHLSVRRDVLEEQIASMKPQIEYLSDFGEVSMAGNMNIELDRATLLDMIDSAKPNRALPIELRGILFEELDLYLAGSITEDMLIDHLENRIGLYLGERN